jgi:sugar O-acyltransferase (sialic acid O-acetyltransferase NeuD family)
MKKIVLFGGGNQVHYTLDIIEKQGLYKVIGIIDSVHDIGSERFGYKVIGRQEDIKSLIEEYEIEGGIITIGDNWIRYYVSQQIKSLIRDFEFVNAIHPSVVIGNNVQIGTGVVAMAGVIINPMAKIGNHTFFATGSQIEHDCIIEDFASVSAGSILGGYVQIKKYSAITLNVTILDRLIIGENCVVGSGSLVLKDIPDNIFAYGNTCKNIRYRPIGEKFLK